MRGMVLTVKTLGQRVPIRDLPVRMCEGPPLSGRPFHCQPIAAFRQALTIPAAGIASIRLAASGVRQ